MIQEVFVSHAPSDESAAAEVSEFLETEGVRCGWVPGEASSPLAPPGLRREALKKSRMVVVIFSSAANSSPAMLKEVQHAIEAQKPLILFRLQDVAPAGAMESFMRHRYCLDAFAAPLEESLRELVRIIKPITGKGGVKAAEDASISRTLPARTSVLLRSKDHPAVSREWTGPLQVWIRCPAIIEAGGTSDLEVQVSNGQDQKLDHVEISLESAALEGVQTRMLGGMSCGAQAYASFPIAPTRPGPGLLRFTIKARQDETQFSYVGSRPLRVSEALPETDSGGEVDFEPLDLALDYAHTGMAEALLNARPELSIPWAFLAQEQSGTLLVLEPMEAVSGIPHQEIRLSARAGFVLGRSREESDFLLWFWPRNEIHDTKTLRISKKQCTLTLSQGHCWIGSTAASRVTTFDGENVDEAGVSLGRRGILNVSGIYSLDIAHFPAAYPGGPPVSNLQEWKGTAPKTRPEGTGSVRFVPVTAHTLPQYSTWLLSEGTFGTSRANAIVLDLKNLAEIQGRFHHFQGGFWIENCAENSAVQLDNCTLKAGSIAPLVNGKIISLGGQRFCIRVQA